ncbi:beta-lactamase family protein [Acinetobacter sp. NIPH 1852]|uniref:serine hydrolase domain-containing protein n=1 Tax=Acinetobacter sp. NIPH 1852 TaxID=2923428 RepID=UPI001F4AA89F|nr:beta-lactamase family protein [Acinetobacter sp. NIPH 1852]MCH7308212.1 beta-lactamase family protein [Acinetobacter sp. NIPH 1852]
MSRQFLHIKNIQKKDIIILSLLLCLIISGTYLYSNKNQWLQRTVYYTLQAPFAIKTIKCSQNAPEFMPEFMRYVIEEQKSLNNQLAFKDTQGKLHHCESGWENGFNGDRLITVDSRFRYASVSKVITSAMILHLVNEGKISLDQKLLDIIDIPKPKDQRIENITVAMLLEHSAGFDRFKTFTPMLTMGKKPWCPTDLNKLSNVILDFEPNTQFQYSNVGYCLLGAALLHKPICKGFFSDIIFK